MMAADEKFFHEAGRTMVVNGKSISVGERILLHLGEFSETREDFYGMPYGITQDGIALATQVTRAHASIELKKLKTKGFVKEFQAHVKNVKMVRKVYLLSPEGKVFLKKLKEDLKKRGIEKEQFFTPQREMENKNRNPFVQSAMQKTLRAAIDMRIAEKSVKPDYKQVIRELLSAAMDLLQKE